MRTERSDNKPMPEDEVLFSETRDARGVGGSENKTTPMSNPSQPLDTFLTWRFNSHAITFRNRYLVTIPGHSTAFLLNTTFLEPFICKCWHGNNKALLNTKWNTKHSFIYISSPHRMPESSGKSTLFIPIPPNPPTPSPPSFHPNGDDRFKSLSISHTLYRSHIFCSDCKL